MATTTTTQAKRRQSYVLTYEPPKFSSLSAGTAFEVPVEELERIAAESQAETKQMPGAYPAEEEPSKTSSMEDQSATDQRRSESRQTTSGPNKLRRRPSTQNDRDERPRKLFSLRSLRNSFSSSRSSLNLAARPSQDIQSNRPMSPGPSVLSGNAPASSASQQPQSPQTLRNKRSSTWFGKRRSGFFHADEDGRLAMVSEDPSQEGQDGKRKEDPNLPRLPEVSTLRGGELNDGGLGWNEDIFKA